MACSVTGLSTFSCVLDLVEIFVILFEIECNKVLVFGFMRYWFDYYSSKEFPFTNV
jgi:hypothetical protein